LWQEIILESLFALFVFCNPTDNFDGEDDRVFMVADFGEAASWLSLAILVT